jgi:hypothetical protein
MDDFRRSAGLKAPRRRSAPGMSPEEEEQFAYELARKGLSSVAYIGETLDKPMAAVRGLLAGDVRELANIIPFSDTLGITSSEGLFGGTALQVTDDENTVYGRDLLERYGALNKNKEGFGGSGSWSDIDYADAAGDILGFGVDLIGIPVASGAKALTMGGRALKGAGLLDEAAVAASRLGKSQAASTMGTVGDAIQSVAGVGPTQALARFQTAAGGAKGDALNALLKQRVGYKAALKAPLGMGGEVASLEGIIDPVQRAMSRVAGAAPKSVQALGRGLATAGREVAAAGRTAFSGEAHGLSSPQAQKEVAPLLGQKLAALERNGRDVVSGMAETVNRNQAAFTKLGDGNITAGIYRLYETPRNELPTLASKLTPREMADLAPSYSRVREALDTIPLAGESLGSKSFTLEDLDVDYLTRSVLGKGPGYQKASANRTLSGFDTAGNVQRSKATKNIPGGTATIIKLAQDTAGLGKVDDIAAEAIARGVDPEAAGPLAAFIFRQAPESRRAGIYTDPLNAVNNRIRSFAKAQGNADTVLDTLSNRDLLVRSITPAGNNVPISRVLDGLDLDRQAALTEIAKRMGVGSSPKELDLLGQTPIGERLAGDLISANPKLQGPKPVGPLLNAYDSMTSLFKGSVTSPFPAFNARNRVSGVVREALSGSGNLGSLAGAGGRGVSTPDNIASKLSRGLELNPAEAAQARAIPGIAEYLAEGASTEDALRRLVYRHLPGRGQGYGLDVARDGRRAAAAQTSDEIVDIGMVGGVGGTQAFSGREAIRKLVPRSWAEINPLNQAGVLDNVVSGVPRSRTGFTPAASGQYLGEHVENLNRIAPFLRRVMGGTDPVEAARRVLDTQVDYSRGALSKFENEVMTRAIPFYKFSRGNLPHIIKEVATDPGGRTAALLKASNAQHRVQGTDSQILPDYVADSLAVPMGEGPDGSKRYLRALGLMEEDLFGIVDPQNPVKGLLDEIGGRLNPLLKAPLEIKTNQSFFQTGRPLDQMDPTLGRIVSNLKQLRTGEPQELAAWQPGLGDALLSNSPLSRISTMVRQMTDPRKLPAFLNGQDPDGGLPLLLSQLSGLKVSDISPESMDRQLRDQLAEEMKELGSRSFETQYVPRAAQEQQTPEQARRLRQIKALQKLIKSRGL